MDVYWRTAIKEILQNVFYKKIKEVLKLVSKPPLFCGMSNPGWGHVLFNLSACAFRSFESLGAITILQYPWDGLLA